jgi:aldehyde:ferredoxin oxidoreductase
MVIVNTGPLTGTGAPSSSRFNMSFKNVLSGGIASSNCGGTFGFMMKKAGFDGITITGRAEHPVRIEIIDGEIKIVDATPLWGMDIEEVQEELPAHYGKFVIGPSGENLVRFAGVASGERIAGRCGGGAVFGSKNLKAITAYGTKDIYVKDQVKFHKFLKKWTKFLRSHPMTGEALPRYGSAGLVNKANTNFAMPTHNFKKGHYDDADKVSGETLAETLLTRNGSCVSCPIRCERRVEVEGKEVKGPEYETLGLFGPNVDASDLQMILELNYICDILGMDTISCAGSIAFAMELKERGVVDLGVEFGNVKELREILQKIARREGMYSEIANGSKWLSEKYGGKEYAINAKGLELAAYEPRRSVGMGLGYATSNRGGCHLNGGYAAILESVGVLSMDAQSNKGKAQITIFMQNALEAVAASGFCLFSAQTFVPAILYRFGPNHRFTRAVGKIATFAGPLFTMILKIAPVLLFNTCYLLPHAEAVRLATGFRMYTGPFVMLGDRSFNLERAYSMREGLTSADDSLPDRLTKVPQDSNKPNTVVPLDKMLPTYYRVRGWDKNGVPKQKKLRRLGIV